MQIRLFMIWKNTSINEKKVEKLTIDNWIDGETALLAW